MLINIKRKLSGLSCIAILSIAGLIFDVDLNGLLIEPAYAGTLSRTYTLPDQSKEALLQDLSDAAVLPALTPLTQTPSSINERAPFEKDAAVPRPSSQATVAPGNFQWTVLADTHLPRVTLERLAQTLELFAPVGGHVVFAGLPGRFINGTPTPARVKAQAALAPFIQSQTAAVIDPRVFHRVKQLKAQRGDNTPIGLPCVIVENDKDVVIFEGNARLEWLAGFLAHEGGSEAFRNAWRNALNDTSLAALRDASKVYP